MEAAPEAAEEPEVGAMSHEDAVQKVTKKARMRGAVSDKPDLEAVSIGNIQQMGRADPVRAVSQLAQHSGLIRKEPRSTQALRAIGGQQTRLRPKGTTSAWAETSPVPTIPPLRVLDFTEDFETDHAASPAHTTLLPNLSIPYGVSKGYAQLTEAQSPPNLAQLIASEKSFPGLASPQSLEASRSLTDLHSNKSPTTPVITRKPAPPVLAAFNPKDQWLQKAYKSQGLLPVLPQSSPLNEAGARPKLPNTDQPDERDLELTTSAHAHRRNETWLDVTSASSRLGAYANADGGDLQKSGRRSANDVTRSSKEETALSGETRPRPTTVLGAPRPRLSQRRTPDQTESQNLKPGRRRSESKLEADEKLASSSLEKDLLEGFLAPENLQMYGLGKDECYRLFRALRVYSLGFQEVVLELLQHLADRKEVMLHVWRVFAKLWDTATFTRFESEVISIANERDRLRGQNTDLEQKLKETNSELKVFKEAQGKLMAQAIQRAMEGRTTDEILREAMLEAEETRGKLAVAESRALYEAKGKAEAQDRVTSALTALMEEQEARAGDQAASDARIVSLEADFARAIQDKELCLTSLVELERAFASEKADLKAAARAADDERARVEEEARAHKGAAEEALARIPALEAREKDLQRAKVLLQGDLLAKREQHEGEKERAAALAQQLAVTEIQSDLLAKREQYEAEKERAAALAQQLAVTEENLRFMAHQIDELRASVADGRTKLEESVRKIADKDAELEEKTEIDTEERRKEHEAAVKEIEDKWATARECEMAQRVKKKRYKNKLVDAEKELDKWRADIATADQMYQAGQAVLEKVAVLQGLVDEAALREKQGQVDEAALRENQLCDEKAALEEALQRAEAAVADGKHELELQKQRSDEALRQVLLTAAAEKEEYTRKAEDNHAAAMQDIKILDTRARALEKQVASRDEQIKGLQRDLRRNENATKVLVREKELLACKMTETQVQFEEEKKAREEAWETRLGEVSSRLAETTEGLEKTRAELEEMRRAGQEREELGRREREELVKAKGDGAAEVGRLKERVRVLEEALEKRQEELKAAQRDAIELEASMSVMLEKLEAEKSELSKGAPAARADEGEHSRFGEESRERVRELEAALKGAQREAEHRLEWMQKLLDMLYESHSEGADRRSSSAGKTPRSRERDQTVDSVICGVVLTIDEESTVDGVVDRVVFDVEDEVAHGKLGRRPTIKRTASKLRSNSNVKLSEAVDTASSSKAVQQEDDSAGRVVYEKAKEEWASFLARLSKAELWRGNLTAEVEKLMGINEDLAAQISRLREQLEAAQKAGNSRQTEKAANTRFAEALLKKRERRAQEELEAAVARAGALERALADARRLLAERTRETASEMVVPDAGGVWTNRASMGAGSGKAWVEDAPIQVDLVNEDGSSGGKAVWEAERKSLLDQLATLAAELRKPKPPEPAPERSGKGPLETGTSAAQTDDHRVSVADDGTSPEADGVASSPAERVAATVAETQALRVEVERLASEKEAAASALEVQRAEKEELEARVAALTSELQRALEARDAGDEAAASALAAARAEIEALSAKEQSLAIAAENLEEEKRALGATLAAAQGDIASAVEQATVAKKEKERTASALESLREEKSALEAEVVSIEAELCAFLPDTGEGTVRDRTGSVERARAAAESVRAEMEATKVEVSKMREQLQAEAEQRRAEQEERRAEQTDLEERKAQIEEQKAELEERKAELEQAKAQALEAQQAAAEAQEELGHARASEQKKSLMNLWTQTVPKTGGTVITVKYTPRTLKVLISQVYCDKIAADIADDQEPGGQRQDMKEFVYDFFLFKFGLRAFAELHLLSVLKALEEYASSSQRMLLFGAFIGHANVAPPLPPEALDFFLMYLSRLFGETDGPQPTEFEEGRSDVALPAAASVTAFCFGPDTPGSVTDGLLARVRALCARAQEPAIDVDVLMGLVMETWGQEQKESVQRIGDLFREADENGDGVLSYPEFSGIVRRIDGTVTERAIKNMFREALLDSNSGSRILPASFEKVARAHGLACSRHVSSGGHVAIGKECRHDDLALLRDSWETVAPLIHEQVGTLKKQSNLSSELKDLESQVDGLQSMLRQGGRDTGQGGRDAAPQVWQLYRRIILGFQIQNQRVELRNREEKRVQLGASAFQTLFRGVEGGGEEGEGCKTGVVYLHNKRDLSDSHVVFALSSGQAGGSGAAKASDAKVNEGNLCVERAVNGSGRK
ncbi:hypothetical protein KFL_001590080 [Klebsormidium nitens]|uniref:EF-hand domain-containing protein n=1 Tax=Klebsormidium nitens TaxID=105231 RepID=A0A1Y1HYJ2_KLENI|nr:hypothetical protein KFL_001590080 [Klebsormidium nitens]|eukprot:GAQ83720.1 hypothetical protein KFL_001590080 [Klebsormidium nitens]